MGRDRGGLSEGQGGVIRRIRKASPPRAPSGANNQVTFQPVEIDQKLRSAGTLSNFCCRLVLDD